MNLKRSIIVIIKMSLNKYLSNLGVVSDIEGNSGDIPPQTQRLRDLVSDVSVQNILEIGFNAGHSSDTFLSSSLANVVSFDLQLHDYVTLSKQYIDKKYPGRHTLIIGDSKVTIPQYHADHPDMKFDVIYIDGDHTYEGSTLDILNCKELAHSNTRVIMDDTIFQPNNHATWTIGPSASWSNAVVNKHVNHEGGDYYCPGRGMCWGSYLV